VKLSEISAPRAFFCESVQDDVFIFALITGSSGWHAIADGEQTSTTSARAVGQVEQIVTGKAVVHATIGSFQWPGRSHLAATLLCQRLVLQRWHWWPNLLANWCEISFDECVCANSSMQVARAPLEVIT
jgi:hypothetical protein